eukprot:TRINITY_DN10525_c0_g1_i1.p1 TRINITY_DN10525_c0_g1~~TRINITY_DN10525_c0_g1_i1.p1  ORF type:complete len:410 (-),score=70.13 TRINITY_DN10525_c0_g1_i1:442-1671(-)
MSVLIHSVKGQSRACTVVCSYMMRKYRWALLKSLEFLNSRMSDFEIRPAFIHQLTAYENRLIARGLGPKTFDWTDVFDKMTNDFENEELLLRNTYINAQMGQFVDFSTATAAKTQRVKWADELAGNSLTAVMHEARFAGEGQKRGKKSAVIFLTRIKPAESRNEKPASGKKGELKPQISLPEISRYALVSAKEAKIHSDQQKHVNTQNPKEKSEVPVTQIINQNIVNNFIINNPQKVEVLELSPARVQHIPKLRTTGLMHFNKSSNPKAKLDRPLSVPRQTSPRIATTRESEHRSKGGSSPKQIPKARAAETARQTSDGRVKMRLGSKVEPPKGESSDQPQDPAKAVKSRPATPGAGSKSLKRTKAPRNITIVSVKKPSGKFVSSKESVPSISVGRGVISKPGKHKSNK